MEANIARTYVVSEGLGAKKVVNSKAESEMHEHVTMNAKARNTVVKLIDRTDIESAPAPKKKKIAVDSKLNAVRVTGALLFPLQGHRDPPVTGTQVVSGVPCPPYHCSSFEIVEIAAGKRAKQCRTDLIAVAKRCLALFSFLVPPFLSL